MTKSLTYSDINTTDVFIPATFPEVDTEIGVLKNQLGGRVNADQCAVVISYCKDHSVRVNLARTQAVLVKMLLSMNTCRYIENLFKASKKNERFRHDLEKYLIARFIE